MQCPTLPTSDLEALCRWAKYYVFRQGLIFRLGCTEEEFTQREEAITRNVLRWRQEWREEFGTPPEQRQHMQRHQFPPPQAGAETQTRGKLRGYRLNFLRREGDLAELEAAWDVAIAEAKAAFREARDAKEDS